MRIKVKVIGHEAIELAAARGLLLSKHTDPIEEAREGLSVEEARRIAREDPSLIYVEVLLFDGHDMAIGPCECGAMHYASDAPIVSAAEARAKVH